MLEWLKRHAWKACIPPKGIRGSNPRLSALRSKRKSFEGFLFAFIINKLRRNKFLDGIYEQGVQILNRDIPSNLEYNVMRRAGKLGWT
jgi:hypothetical protein